jgi:serine/threonine protein kinase
MVLTGNRSCSVPHYKEVIYSDLRPANCLVHVSGASLDILLCDFGGSMCSHLDLDGRGLPDHPFWDLVWRSTTATDIFSLGSIFYIIMTGRWPYKPALQSDEKEEKYE